MKRIINEKTEDLDELLVDCLKNNPDPEALKFLIKSGADVNAKGYLGNTPLFYALKNKKTTPEIIRILVEAGANVNAEGYMGRTPIICAMRNKSTTPEMFRILIEAGANVNVYYDAMWSYLTQFGDSILPRMYPCRNSFCRSLLIFHGA